MCEKGRKAKDIYLYMQSTDLKGEGTNELHLSTKMSKITTL